MIGKHIASLNLFNEQDGTYDITCSSADLDVLAGTPNGLKPIDHIENIIIAAALRMKNRKEHDGTFRVVEN